MQEADFVFPKWDPPETRSYVLHRVLLSGIWWSSSTVSVVDVLSVQLGSTNTVFY